MASVRVRIRPTWDAIDGATLRPIAEADLGFLWDMLYEAATATPGIRYLPRSEALALPVVFRHLAGWGRAGDGGVVAVVDGVRAGAAWYRVFAPRDRGAGVVAWPGLPEATVAVAQRALWLGIGGPATRYLDRPGTWDVRVANPGELPLANVEVRVAVPPSVRLQSLGGGRLVGSEVVWRVDELKPGGDLDTRHVCRDRLELPADRVRGIWLHVPQVNVAWRTGVEDEDDRAGPAAPGGRRGLGGLPPRPEGAEGAEAGRVQELAAGGHGGVSAGGRVRRRETAFSCLSSRGASGISAGPALCPPLGGKPLQSPPASGGMVSVL